MKRIFLLLLSASATLAVSCSGGRSSAGKPGVKGELIPKEKANTFVAQKPYGMVAIPSGSFVVGMSDEDITNMPEKAALKTITVSSFFMDETETTNAEYRLFVNYVRDSIARTMLAEVAGEGMGGNRGRGTNISDYAYLEDQEDNNLSPYQEFLESQGDEDYNKKLDWSVPLHWDTSKYPDVEYAEVVESMYLPISERFNNERMIDASKLKFAFQWEDYGSAIADGKRGANYVKRDAVSVYPDTAVWVKDFHYTYNEPLFEQYFWHNAYKDYPVVGVTWVQARAYCDFRSKLKSDYNNSLKKKKSAPFKFRLPTEEEWEYAAQGGLSNPSYPWGGPSLMNDRGCYLANFKPKRGDYMEGEAGFVYTAPVKKFEKNGFGLYDMSGNVAEWTLSQYDNASYGFTSTLNPTTKRTSDTKKSVRGGSWKDIGALLMVGYRDWEYKDSARSYIGFRTVQDIPEAARKVRRRKITK